MRAGELLTPIPPITPGTPVSDTVRPPAEQDLPGPIVVDESGLPGTRVPRPPVPGCRPDESAPGRTVDEAHATVREIAALMAGGRSPLAAAVSQGRSPGGGTPRTPAERVAAV